jgi:hypothetical protein
LCEIIGEDELEKMGMKIFGTKVREITEMYEGRYRRCVDKENENVGKKYEGGMIIDVGTI